MRTKIFLILAMCLAGAIIPVLLYETNFTLNRDKNGFTRQLSGPVLEPKLVSVTLPDVYRIVAFDGRNCVVSCLATGTYIDLDSGLIPKSFHRPKYRFGDQVHTSFQMRMDPFDAFVAVGNFRTVYRVNRADSRVVDSAKAPFVFLRSCQADQRSLAVRYFDTNRAHTERFGLLKWGQPGEAKTFSSITDPDDRQDGDGLIAYSRLLSEYVFTMFFSGTYQIRDSNFSLVAVGHTVDTVRFTPTREAAVSSSPHYVKFTNVTPRYVVNNVSSVSGDRLYVESMIKADNQTRAEFAACYTIDVYDLRSRKYLHSIAVPKAEEKSLVDFRVSGDDLLVLYDDHLELFSLPL